MSEQAKAIVGTLFSYKTLADGSLRITIDLGDQQARPFHELFPSVHGMVAVAPLAILEEKLNE